jgi:thiol:disulfide interchange protein
MGLTLLKGVIALFFPAIAILLDWLAYSHHKVSLQPFLVIMVMAVVFAALAGAALGIAAGADGPREA